MAGDKSLPTPEQAQLGIWIKTAVTNPSAEKQILARKFVAAGVVRAGDGGANFLGQARTHLLISVQQQHPILGAQLDRILFLRDVAAPRFKHDAGSVFPCDLAGAIRRAGIDEHDLIGPAHAGQRTADVGFFVHRYDGHGNGHREIADCNVDC